MLLKGYNDITRGSVGIHMPCDTSFQCLKFYCHTQEVPAHTSVMFLENRDHRNSMLNLLLFGLKN